MAQLEVHDLAQAVIDRMADCKEPRLKEVMSALVCLLYTSDAADERIV